jgi:hypothetical protein
LTLSSSNEPDRRVFGLIARVSGGLSCAAR